MLVGKLESIKKWVQAAFGLASSVKKSGALSEFCESWCSSGGAAIHSEASPPPFDLSFFSYRPMSNQRSYPATGWNVGYLRITGVVLHSWLTFVITALIVMGNAMNRGRIDYYC